MIELDRLLDESLGELITTNVVTETFRLTDKLELTLKALDIKETLGAESYFEKNWAYAGDIIGRARKLSIVSAATIKINGVDVDRTTPEKDLESTIKIRERFSKMGGEIVDCIYEKYLGILEKRQNIFCDYGGALKNFLKPLPEKS
jgi:hypothetical protein